MWSPLVLPAVRIIDLSSTQNLIDVCLQETGGLGVNCAIDSGGKVGTIHNIFAPLALIFVMALGRICTCYILQIQGSLPKTTDSISSPKLEFNSPWY